MNKACQGSTVYLLSASLLVASCAGQPSRDKINQISPASSPPPPAHKDRSLSPDTINILRSLDDVVVIRVFFSRNLPPDLRKTADDVMDMLAQYKASAGKYIFFKWIDPAASEELRNEVASKGIPEIPFQTHEAGNAQATKGYMGIEVQYAERLEILPVVRNVDNLEHDLTMAIAKVFRPSQLESQAPKPGEK